MTEKTNELIAQFGVDATASRGLPTRIAPVVEQQTKAWKESITKARGGAKGIAFIPGKNVTTINSLAAELETQPQQVNQAVSRMIKNDSNTVRMKFPIEKGKQPVYIVLDNSQIGPEERKLVRYNINNASKLDQIVSQKIAESKK